LEIEPVDVGNKMTVDLNFGVINIGEEKMIAPIKAIAEIIMIGLRQWYKNNRKFVESKSLFS
jgi:hypothetical protein